MSQTERENQGQGNNFSVTIKFSGTISAEQLFTLLIIQVFGLSDREAKKIAESRSGNLWDVPPSPEQLTSGSITGSISHLFADGLVKQYQETLDEDIKSFLQNSANSVKELEDYKRLIKIGNKLKELKQKDPDYFDFFKRETTRPIKDITGFLGIIYLDVRPRIISPEAARDNNNYQSPYYARNKKTDQSRDETFTIKSNSSSTVKLGNVVIYSIEQIQETIIPAGSVYNYQWSVDVYPTQPTRNIIPYPVPSKNSARMVLTTRYPGEHIVKVRVLLNESLVSQLEFKQTVNDDGRTQFHKNLIDEAKGTPIPKGVEEWDFGKFTAWQTGNLDLNKFKNQWVIGYKDVIKKAASQFNIPAILLAGVAHVEVGGDPPIADDVASSIRNIPGAGHFQPPADLTSFGNLSTQVRRGAEALGYEPDKLTGEQRNQIVDSLKDSRQNIFIAAKHLSDLRDIEFPGVGADEMTLEEMMVIAGRFNVGPDAKFGDIGKYVKGYGQKTVKDRPNENPDVFENFR